MRGGDVAIRVVAVVPSEYCVGGASDGDVEALRQKKNTTQDISAVCNGECK